MSASPKPTKPPSPKSRRVDPEVLAASQGVQPIADPKELRGDFWPEDENLDDFLAELRKWRQEGREDR